MNYEEFHKKIKKSEEKMVEAVVGDHKKNEYISLTLSCASSLSKISSRDITVSFEQKGGQKSICAIHGKENDIAFAIYNLMDYNDNFYETLTRVCAFRKMYECGSFKTESRIYNCESKEQQEIFRELLRKSPEEVDRLKEELKK